MKKAFIFLLLIFIFRFSVYSQLENHIWHYGNTAKGLEFDLLTNAPAVTNVSYTPYSTGTGSSIVNPTTGTLIYYSDGKNVIDINHDVMPNGSGLIGAPATFSSGVSCKVPGNCNLWYVFSITTQTEFWPAPVIGNLYYSIVDMSLPGNGSVPVPLGDVVVGQKNILVATNVSEGIEIIPKSGSHDYYLLVGKNSTSSIDIYEVTSSGIAFLSNQLLGSTITDVFRIRHSAAGNKVAICSMVENEPVVSFDFDSSNGGCSSVGPITGTPIGTSASHFAGTIDVEFSPDGTKLYISKFRGNTPSTGGKLYQFDFNTPGSPPVLIFSVSTSPSVNAKGLQLGPDGKIYFLDMETSSVMQFISVINDPNIAGSGCNFVSNDLDLGASVGGNMSLFPTIYKFANTIPLISDSTLNFLCQVPPIISFDPLSGYSDGEGDNLLFNVNSVIGGTFNIVGSTINFTIDPGFVGTPQIEIIYTDDFCYALSDTFIVDMSVAVGSGVLNLPDTTQACIGTLIQLDAGAGFDSYLWSDGATSQTINAIANGQYFVETVDGACIYYDTTFVQYNVPVAVNLGPDQTICADSLMLTTGVFNGTINWSDGFVGEDNWISVSNQYSVIAEDVNGCFSYDTTTIILNPIPQINLGPDLNFCSYDLIYLEAIGFTSVLWNDGSINDSLFVNQSGNYDVLVTNAFGCTSVDDVNLIFNVPDQINIGVDVTVCSSSYLISSAGFSGSVLWSNGNSGSTNLVSVSGLNSAIGTDLNGCLSYDTIDVFLAPIPTINLGTDTTICPSGMILDASGFSTVIWSDGSTNTTLEVLIAGLYSVEVTNIFGCIAGDIVEITFHDPSAISLGPDYETCSNNEVTILTGVDEGDFLWSNGSTQSQITVSETGTYTIQQTLCGTIVYDTIFVEISTLDQVVYIPNAFTPDGNLLNNEFRIVFGDYSHVLNYQLSIYDRWGHVIYFTTDPYGFWDGTYTHGLVPDGIYVYVVRIETDCDENQYWVRTGHVAVLK